jgi:hypothetical protein
MTSMIPNGPPVGRGFQKYTERVGSDSKGGLPAERTLRKDIVATLAFNWNSREDASGGIEQAPLPKAELD